MTKELKQILKMAYNILVILETIDTEKTITATYIKSARQNVSNALSTITTHKS